MNKDFKNIKTLFRKFNIALPSSAAIERAVVLFSIAKNVLKDDRCRLSDEDFERQLFLNLNKEFNLELH
jgi:hypothetical protein